MEHCTMNGMREYTCIVEVDAEKYRVRFPAFKPSVVISVAETKAREWYKQKYDKEATTVHVKVIAPSFTDEN